MTVFNYSVQQGCVLAPSHKETDLQIFCDYAAANPNNVSNFPSKTVGFVQYPVWHVAFFGFLAAVVSLVTVTGNLVVILSFVFERSIRQPTNYFIASLAVSDLLIGSTSMPFYTIYLLSGQHWLLGEGLCDLWLSIDYTACLCSIYTVFCITADRFFSVRIPAVYRKWRTERKVVCLVAATWILPFIVFFTSIFGWQHFTGIRTVPAGKCYVQYMDEALFNFLLQVGYFWITVVAMFALYAGIYKVAVGLHRRSRAMREQSMACLVSMAGRTVTQIGSVISISTNRNTSQRLLDQRLMTRFPTCFEADDQNDEQQHTDVITTSPIHSDFTLITSRVNSVKRCSPALHTTLSRSDKCGDIETGLDFEARKEKCKERLEYEKLKKRDEEPIVKTKATTQKLVEDTMCLLGANKSLQESRHLLDMNRKLTHLLSTDPLYCGIACAASDTTELKSADFHAQNSVNNIKKYGTMNDGFTEKKPIDNISPVSRPKPGGLRKVEIALGQSSSALSSVSMRSPSLYFPAGKDPQEQNVHWDTKLSSKASDQKVVNPNVLINSQGWSWGLTPFRGDSAQEVIGRSASERRLDFRQRKQKNDVVEDCCKEITVNTLKSPTGDLVENISNVPPNSSTTCISNSSNLYTECLPNRSLVWRQENVTKNEIKIPVPDTDIIDLGGQDMFMDSMETSVSLNSVIVGSSRSLQKSPTSVQGSVHTFTSSHDKPNAVTGQAVKRTFYCSAALAVSGRPDRVKGVPYVDDDHSLKSLQSSKSSRDLISSGNADLSVLFDDTFDVERECQISLESKTDGENSFDLMETDGGCYDCSAPNDATFNILSDEFSLNGLTQNQRVIEITKLSSPSFSSSSSYTSGDDKRINANSFELDVALKSNPVSDTEMARNENNSVSNVEESLAIDCLTIHNAELKPRVSTLLERRLWHQMNSLSQEPTNFKFTVGRWRKKPSDSMIIPKVLIELASCGGGGSFHSGGATRCSRHNEKDEIFDDKSSEDSCCDEVTPEPTTKPSHQRLNLIVGRMGSTSTTSTNVSTPPISVGVSSAGVKRESSKSITSSLRSSVLNLGGDKWYGRSRSEPTTGVSGENLTKRNEQSAQVRNQNRTRKALRTITIILGAFVICWIPWHVLSLIIGFCRREKRNDCVTPLLYDVSYWLCYLNSPINPFCYAFANQQFKKAFIRTMRLDWRRK